MGDGAAPGIDRATGGGLRVAGPPRDYWDIVRAQLRKRPSVRIATVLLVLLYAIAIYAPFLAGDRPLLLTATDAAAYRKAQKSLTAPARSLAKLIEAGPAGYATSEPGRTWEDALAGERQALEQRVQTMREQLAPADAAPLDELLAALAAACGAATSGDAGAASTAAGQVVALATRAREQLAPAEPGQAPEPGKTVALRAHTSSPALEAVSRGELYFMLLWLFVLCWPLWSRAVDRWLLQGDVERIRRARRSKFVAVLLLPVLPALLWSPSADPFTTSAFKAGLTSGDITATTAVMPPVPFGLADQNGAEYFRAPTWTDEAEISAEGYYVRGARAERSSGLDGFTTPPIPVVVQSVEPAANDAARHPLGTDGLGRDMLARMIWGGRVSLSVGLVSTLLLVVIGIIFGALAGYYGGWTDVLISRLIEIFQCFPPFFLILIIVAFLGPDITFIMVVLGITRWPGVARLVRGEFLRLREQDFVVASEALGVPQRRTIFRHILPNAMGPVLVAATFSVASGILIESALSFLGFGVQLPVPSWGSLLVESRRAEDWWIQIFPGLIIFLTVILYNLLGEGVRDALDPRLKTA